MTQGRRVRRVIRRVDTWSVLKVASLFYLSLVVVVLLAGVLLWLAGSAVGAIGGVEKFMRGIGFEGFEFVPSQLLRGFVAAGLVVVIVGTGFSVLLSVIYNLISDVVGGIELIELEEDRTPVGVPARDGYPDPAVSPSGPDRGAIAQPVRAQH